MIVSASRRTDIPAYYSEWFMNRLRAGSLLVRNPMNHAQLRRLPLSPQVVDCIVFWTKDPALLLPHLDELDAMGYRYYFQFTLTPYGQDIEGGLRGKADILKTMLALSQRIGPQGIVWRYDPILLSDCYGVNWHCDQFDQLCETLGGRIASVTISLLDSYAKLGAVPFRAPDAQETQLLCRHFLQTATKHSLSVNACCEAGLSQYGIGQAHCIDKRAIEQICNKSLSLKPDKNQRTGCGCYESIDIVAYDSCPAGCAYCYAIHGLAVARRNHTAHDPASELLLGQVREGETIRLVDAASHGQAQLSFD